MRLIENPQTRFKKIITGNDPKIYSFGIITAYNPMNQQLSRKENIDRNEKLKKDLKITGREYIELSYGMYDSNKRYDEPGKKEEPLMVLNINSRELESLGKSYEQESFIYAERENDGRWIFWYYDRPDKESDYKIEDDGVIDYYNIIHDEEQKNFYTRMKTWRFSIPFPMFEQIIKKAERHLFERYNIHNQLTEEVIDDINRDNFEIVNNKECNNKHFLNTRLTIQGRVKHGDLDIYSENKKREIDERWERNGIEEKIREINEERMRKRKESIKKKESNKWREQFK